jgi:UPF0755 protein
VRSLYSSAKVVAIIFIALVGIAAYALFLPVSISQSGILFYVPQGTSRANVVADLSANHLIRLAPIFDFYSQMRGRVPRSGEYKLARGSSPYAIWQQITNGTGRYYRSFTIIPGTTFKQIKLSMQKTPTLRHVTANMNDQQIMAMLSESTRGPEGMFMPETYNYSRDDADLVVLKRAHVLMNLKLNEAWQNRGANLPFQDAYQALIAASLIEKEAYLAKEQPIISGVLVNRLQKGMLLQFDPTIIYGLGDQYRGKIYKSDLTTDTPYNSYMHKGLPPTPIAMPGLTAIQAAMHPAQHDYLYFVATGNGSHAFTTNLQDHYAEVSKAAALRAKSIPAATPTPATPVTGGAHAAS